MSVESLMEKLCKILALELIPRALAGTGIPPQVTRAVLETFVDLRTEDHYDKQLQKFMESHYKSGVNHLTDARYAEQEVRRNEALNRAISELTKASNVENGLRKAKSQFLVGVCHELQQERTSAKWWYEQAYSTASQVAAQLHPPPDLDGIGTTMTWGGGALGSIVFPGVGTGIGVALGWVTGKAAQWVVNDLPREKWEKQQKEILLFTKPLSEVLVAHGSMVIRQ